MSRTLFALALVGVIGLAAGCAQQAPPSLDDAFGDYPHRVHYALKANSTLGIVRVIRELGGRVDANSGGEIEVALRVGFAPDDIVFCGVGKTRGELERAIGLGLHAINAESKGELQRIDEVAIVGRVVGEAGT